MSHADHPRICIEEWGEIPAGHKDAILMPAEPGTAPHALQFGFHVLNEGQAAYDIAVEDFEIESSVKVKGGSVRRLGAEERGFVLVWLHGFARHSGRILEPAKFDLLTAMATAASRKLHNALFPPDLSVPVFVKYRDSHDRWYRSGAEMVYVRSRHRIEFRTIQHHILPSGKSAAELLWADSADSEDGWHRRIAADQQVLAAQEEGVAAASKVLEACPGFPAAYCRLHDIGDPLLAQLVGKSPSAPLAMELFEAHARVMVELVSTPDTRAAYITLLQDAYFPLAYQFTFGGLNVQPATASQWELVYALERRVRHWTSEAFKRTLLRHVSSAPASEGQSEHSGIDFSTEASRRSALVAYTVFWNCSEAALGRTARVDPADLSKWKKDSLPPTSDKKRRIEEVLQTNRSPTPSRTS